MQSRLKILVSIGGGPEAYSALAFAALLSRRECADISLLTIREPDRGLSSGGLELRVAREHMLGWGLELPGLRRLKKARDIFAELGEIPGDSPEQWEHRSLKGDPAGEYVVSYQTPCGGTVSLHLQTGTDLPGIVADQCDREDVSVAIVGAPGDTPSGIKRLVQGKPLAYRIAQRAQCPVIVARNLDAKNGILAVLDGSERASRSLSLLARVAASCMTHLSIATTAGAEVVDRARKALPLNTPPIHEVFETSLDAEAVVQAGKDYSLIAVPASEGKFRGSFAESVLHNAGNSVMLLK